MSNFLNNIHSYGVILFIQRSSSSYSDADTSGNPFGEDDDEKLINHNL